MEKIDHKKELKHLYKASAKKIDVVDVPALNYLMIDGHGNPNTSQSYVEAVGALFSVSYTAKFMIKKGTIEVDYSVMPLEGLWWADDMSVFTGDDKTQWKWTMMIMQPPIVSRQIIESAIAEVTKKKKLPAIQLLRFESFIEGRCAQTLHVGPFSEEGPTIERLHQQIQTHATLSGKHHEIYLSDIRKAAPDKWKTIIRQPFG